MGVMKKIKNAVSETATLLLHLKGKVKRDKKCLPLPGMRNNKSMHNQLDV